MPIGCLRNHLSQHSWVNPVQPEKSREEACPEEKRHALPNEQRCQREPVHGAAAFLRVREQCRGVFSTQHDFLHDEDTHPEGQGQQHQPVPGNGDGTEESRFRENIARTRPKNDDS